MPKKIIIMTLIICFISSSGNAFLNPKLLTKFSYGYNLGNENRSSQKFGGIFAFELEFIRFLSAGIFLGGSKASIMNLDLQTDHAQENRANVSAILIDIGAYIKPQIPISLGSLTFTPYMSFNIGTPSFSVIRGVHAENYKNNFVSTQFYSALLGVDFTVADHWMFLIETGVATNFRLIKPYFLLIPYSINVGVGYRF
jgi:opacity protein-like surface antigen